MVARCAIIQGAVWGRCRDRDSRADKAIWVSGGRQGHDSACGTRGGPGLAWTQRCWQDDNRAYAQRDPAPNGGQSLGGGLRGDRGQSCGPSTCGCVDRGTGPLHTDDGP